MKQRRKAYCQPDSNAQPHIFVEPRLPLHSSQCLCQGRFSGVDADALLSRAELAENAVDKEIEAMALGLQRTQWHE